MAKEAPLTEAVYYILLAVRNPNHGYGIISNTEFKLYSDKQSLKSKYESIEKSHLSFK